MTKASNFESIAIVISDSIFSAKVFQEKVCKHRETEWQIQNVNRERLCKNERVKRFIMEKRL